MMKFNKKYVGVILALAMLFSLFAVNVAADGATATSESTITVYLNHNAIYSAQGSFTVVAEEGVEYEIVSFTSQGMAMTMSKDTQKFNGYSAYAENLSLALTLKIKGTPAEDAVKVIFNYEYQAESALNGGVLLAATPVEYSLDVVDYTALNAALAEFATLNSAEYTNASWAAASSAASAARALVGRSYNQAEVDAAAAALTDAIAALVKLNVSYLALEAKIAEAKALTADEYTASSWAAFLPVLAEAEDFLARKNAQAQSEIDAVVTKLDNAMKALVKLTTPEIPSDRYEEGFEDGKNSVTIPSDRYDEGFEDGKNSVTIPADRYDEGFEAGKNSVTIPADRYDEGYDAGYDKGYEEGYQKGLADAKTDSADDDEEETTTPAVDTKAPVEQKSATVWIVLFIVFLTTTLGLAGYVVFTLVIKKKKETDDTPVVDYNIEDDAE